jgi:AraC family transcriptional regulator, transcriptional activator of pobA
MLFFKEIQDIIGFTRFPESSHLPNFHIIRMDDSGKNFVKMMPPYCQDFYQIGFQFQMLETTFSFQSESFSTLQNLLYFVAPNQTMSWVVEKQNSGFILYFKRDFLSFFKKEIEEEFSFFRIDQTNLYQLTKEQFDLVFNEVILIRNTFKNQSIHQLGILQGLVLSLLYRCKEIHEQNEQSQKSFPKPKILVQKFENMVQKFFLEKQKIEDYANLLNVTPNYLSAVVSSELSQSAKSIIHQRLILEAKNLLTYTHQDISEIAFQLGFKEMTHFGRFFKKELGISPSEWRKDKTKS